MKKISKEEISALTPPGLKKNASKFKILGSLAVGGIILAAVWQSSINPFGKFRSSAVIPPVVEPSPKPVTAIKATATSEPNLADLQASIAGLLVRIEALETTSEQTAATGETPAAAVVSPPPAAAFQPQNIYLGSASTTQREWTASGLEVAVDSGDYPSDVKAVFEAGLSIVGGEAWARLKNITNGAIISASEVMHNNATVTWKASPAFKLHAGKNVYSVEIKSSSDEKAYLSGSRLRISR
jgi:hypothetical protein